MEELTIKVIEKLKDAESKDQMLDIVSQKLQILVKKFEDRIFTSFTPSREYKADKSAKEEINYIKAVLEGSGEQEISNPEKFTLIKHHVDQVSHRLRAAI